MERWQTQEAGWLSSFVPNAFRTVAVNNRCGLHLRVPQAHAANALRLCLRAGRGHCLGGFRAVAHRTVTCTSLDLGSNFILAGALWLCSVMAEMMAL